MAAKKTKGGAPAGRNAASLDEFDRRWHLADTPHEISVTELEYSLFRVHEAFLRLDGYGHYHEEYVKQDGAWRWIDPRDVDFEDLQRWG